jgi:hypothetical protein
MMEPRFERARVLAEAVGVAANTLKDPIDRVKVTRDKIFISAGRERLELAYTYDNAYSQDGSIMPGSGHWSVSIIKLTKASWFTL